MAASRFLFVRVATLASALLPLALLPLAVGDAVEAPRCLSTVPGECGDVEDPALIQVHAANASAAAPANEEQQLDVPSEEEAPLPPPPPPAVAPPPLPSPPLSSESMWRNPCPPIYLPKQSKMPLCKAAGLVYVGRKFSDNPHSSQCCVKTSWTCNLGTPMSCKSNGLVKAVWLDPNCCVAPVPIISPMKSWEFGVPGTWQQCKSKDLPGYYMHAFWTGKMCMTMASRGPVNIVPKCKKTAICPPGGLAVGNGYCCGLL